MEMSIARERTWLLCPRSSIYKVEERGGDEGEKTSPYMVGREDWYTGLVWLEICRNVVVKCMEEQESRKLPLRSLSGWCTSWIEAISSH